MTKLNIKLTTKISWWVKPALYVWATWRVLRDGDVPATAPAWVLRGIKTKVEST